MSSNFAMRLNGRGYRNCRNYRDGGRCRDDVTLVNVVNP